jgi:hypothetical protein
MGIICTSLYLNEPLNVEIAAKLMDTSNWAIMFDEKDLRIRGLKLNYFGFVQTGEF